MNSLFRLSGNDISMGVIVDQKPVKLIASIICREGESTSWVESSLVDEFGFLEGLTRKLPFDFTDYYQKEFGKPLERRFICFKRPVGLEKMPLVKIAANRIEDGFRQDGKRRFNIDPGYVTEAKLVLLTTKDYSHRIHIGNNIFAESTLHYQGGTFKSWPWTYPDYASKESIAYFNEVRELYALDRKDL
ncbi:MAG: DUF4416 family protein [Candidatus Omnitrophica bacterium]|nr:DUF4416 family protein [Candidatus Omnitrophota bacterium]